MYVCSACAYFVKTVSASFSLISQDWCGFIALFYICMGVVSYHLICPALCTPLICFSFRNVPPHVFCHLDMWCIALFFAFNFPIISFLQELSLWDAYSVLSLVSLRGVTGLVVLSIGLVLWVGLSYYRLAWFHGGLPWEAPLLRFTTLDEKNVPCIITF